MAQQAPFPFILRGATSSLGSGDEGGKGGGLGPNDLLPEQRAIPFGRVALFVGECISTLFPLPSSCISKDLKPSYTHLIQILYKISSWMKTFEYPPPGVF